MKRTYTTTARRFFALLLVLAVLGTAQAGNNYYVASTGSDSMGTGSAGNPWATLTNAVAKATDNNGDTITILDAVHTECSIAIGKSLTIQGQGMTNTILQAAATRSNATDRIFYVNTVTPKNVIFQNMTLCYGFVNSSAASAYGGSAIRNDYSTVTVQNCSIAMNDSYLTASSVSGGGALLQVFAGSSLIISNCIVSSNTVGGSTSSGQQGGGVKIANGSLLIYGSAFFANRAAQNGGAVAIGASPSALLCNSTFFGNLAPGNEGGALYSVPTATSTLVYNCSIYSNTALYGGGIYGGAVNICSSIIATNVTPAGASTELYGGANMSVSNSLIKGNINGTLKADLYNIKGKDPLLNPLAYNGGTTPTFALQATSPCTNTGFNILGLAYDQRGPGYGRTRGPATDMGAFEYGAGFLTYSSTNFTELSPYTTGAIDNTTPMVITLTGDTFTGSVNDELYGLGKVAVTNLPLGLTPVFTLTTTTNINVTLTGNATAHAATNSINNLQFVFQDTAFTLGYASQMGSYNVTNLAVKFKDAASSGTLTYSGTNFNENPILNDGSIITTNAIYLSGGANFLGNPGDNFVSKGWVTPANIPNGLTAVVTCVSSTNLNMTLVGKAVANAAANSTNNLGLTFLDAAFDGGIHASSVVNYSVTNLSVTFIDPPTNVQLLYTNGTVFSESPANDGSIATTIVITLTNDVFTGNNGDNFVTTGKVVPTNVPNGLTAVVSRVDATHLNATLAGHASAHNSVNKVTNLTFTFQNSAFQAAASAAVVTNSALSTLSISFLNPILTYSGTTFVESWQNDGSIGNNPLTITLAGDTFIGTTGEDFVVTGKVVPANVPNGLTASVVLQGGSQLAFSLLGNASPNNATNSIADLGLAFQNSAFSQGGAFAVTNGSVNNLAVLFVGASPPSNFWVSAISGSDTTGDGSSNHPWATIPFAINNTAVRTDAFDTINVMVGTYYVTNYTVSKVVNIQGSGMGKTFVQPAMAYGAATNNVRAFSLYTNSALRDMTLQYGLATNTGSHGSAVLCNAPQTLLERCLITSNLVYGAASYDGGAVYNQSGNLTMNSCAVINNSAYVGGVAGALVYYPSSASFSNCQFSGNSSMHSGGGLYVHSTMVSISDSTFSGNSVALSSANGGGFDSDYTLGTAIVQRCTFIGNQSAGAGGGVYIKTPVVTFIQCTVYGNTAATNSADLPAGGGGGVYVYGALTGGVVDFYNCTIAGNSVTAGNGVGGGIVSEYGPLTLVSTIVAGNSASGGSPDISYGSSLPTDNHCLIGNNTNTAIIAGQPNANGSYVGTSAAPINPMLLPAANNGGLTWTCALLHSSPAVDHGTNPLGLTTDQRGGQNARQIGSAVDIGAFEYMPPRGTTLFFW